MAAAGAGRRRDGESDGALASNHGEIVHQWCLDGQGVALRSAWDVKENIDSGRLVHILPEYFQPANIWAVYVSRLATSAKVRVTVEFLRDYFREHYGETGRRVKIRRGPEAKNVRQIILCS